MQDLLRMDPSRWLLSGRSVARGTPWRGRPPPPKGLFREGATGRGGEAPIRIAVRSVVRVEEPPFSIPSSPSPILITTPSVVRVETSPPPSVVRVETSPPPPLSIPPRLDFRFRVCLKCPLFSKCSLTIDTVVRPDNGCSENAHNLTSQQLAAREVEVIDIASISRDYWSKMISAPNIDLTTFKSQRTNRGPLLKGWMDSCSPVMTTYKLVIMDAPIWGLGERLEDCMIAGERALFLACHRLCFAWVDGWYGMTMDQIREMERHNDQLLKKTLKKPAKAGSKHEGKRKSLKDEIAAVGSCT